jgi:hypothetical protein
VREESDGRVMCVQCGAPLLVPNGVTPKVSYHTVTGSHLRVRSGSNGMRFSVAKRRNRLRAKTPRTPNPARPVDFLPPLPCAHASRCSEMPHLRPAAPRRPCAQHRDGLRRPHLASDDLRRALIHALRSARRRVTRSRRGAVAGQPTPGSYGNFSELHRSPYLRGHQRFGSGKSEHRWSSAPSTSRR